MAVLVQLAAAAALSFLIYDNNFGSLLNVPSLIILILAPLFEFVLRSIFKNLPEKAKRMNIGFYFAGFIISVLQIIALHSEHYLTEAWRICLIPLLYSSILSIITTIITNYINGSFSVYLIKKSKKIAIKIHSF